MVGEEFDYRDRAVLLEPLIRAVNHYLDSLAWSHPLQVTSMPEKGSPYVFVGSSEALTAPPGGEMMREEHQRFSPMIIYLKKPSKSWRAELEKALEEMDFHLALAIRVGFVEYPKTSKGLFEKKVILGTDYERGIRFLSAEDEPVEVLQLTGVLLNREGEVVRAGAEGIIHEDTPFWAQAFDIQKGIDDRAIASLITEFRRDDLPGRPLAWQVALETIVHELLAPKKGATAWLRGRPD